MFSLRFRTTLAALALVLAVASGCDNASPTAVTSEATAAEDAAVSIANALALDSGGALDDAATAVALGSPSGQNVHGGGDPTDHPGCTVERAFDAETFLWTTVFACERGRPDGLFFARFGRTNTHQFYDAGGQPQQFPEGASSLDFAIVDGHGIRVAPGFTHRLLDIGANFDVENLQGDLVTINGTYNRSATDTLYTRRVERTLAYDLSMTFLDVQAPPGDRSNWRDAVSGRIEGTYDALVTFSGPRGYSEREIHTTFVIVFGETDGERDARITVDGRTFRADIETGAVLGVD